MNKINHSSGSLTKNKESYLQRILNGPLPFLLPALILLFIFRGYSFFYQIYISLTDLTIAGEADFIGFDNFVYLLTDPSFRSTLSYTFIFVISNIILQFVIGLSIAIILNKPLFGRNFVRMCVLVPWVVSGIIMGYMWSIMLIESDIGVLNALLNLIGIDSIRWLSVPLNAQISMIITNVWRKTAFAMIFMLAGLQTIPEYVMEAATIDGANEWQKFIKIKLPMMKPVILITLIFLTIKNFNVYEQILTITNGGPGNATEVIALNMYKTAFGQQGALGLGSAIGVIMLLFTLTFALGYLFIAGKE